MLFFPGVNRVDFPYLHRDINILFPGVNRVDFPYMHRDPDGMDIVCQLLKYNPHDRLPMLPGGALSNLRGARWYRGFDWDGLWNFTVTPPYQPKVTSNVDTGNFRASENDLPPQLPYVDPQTNWDAEF
jgi:hypothetical protein